MKIVNVELHEEKINPKFGIPEDYTSFQVIANDGDEDSADQYIRVPNRPDHPLYQEVREWYSAQKKKPFKFDFKDGRRTTKTPDVE